MRAVAEGRTGFQAQFREHRRRRDGNARIDQNGEQAGQGEFRPEFVAAPKHHARVLRETDGHIRARGGRGPVPARITKRNVV